MNKIIELRSGDAKEIQEILKKSLQIARDIQSKKYASEVDAALTVISRKLADVTLPDPHAHAMLEIMRWVMADPQRSRNVHSIGGRHWSASDNLSISSIRNGPRWEADNPTALWEAIQAKEGK